MNTEPHNPELFGIKKINETKAIERVQTETIVAIVSFPRFLLLLFLLCRHQRGFAQRDEWRLEEALCMQNQVTKNAKYYIYIY